jgi:hypothetical protein
MAPKTSKWMATVASAAISVMVGGAAFAAPASALEGTGTTMGLFPDPISEAVAAGRTAVAEDQRQVGQVTNSLRSTGADSASTMGLLPDPISEALENGRTTVAEGQRQVRQVTNSLPSTDGASDVISKALGTVLSKVGSKVAEVKGQARGALNQ